jgi:hypothetical protein
MVVFHKIIDLGDYLPLPERERSYFYQRGVNLLPPPIRYLLKTSMLSVFVKLNEVTSS